MSKARPALRKRVNVHRGPRPIAQGPGLVVVRYEEKKRPYYSLDKETSSRGY